MLAPNFALGLLAQASEPSGLGRIVGYLPTSPAALVTILLLAGAVGWVVWAGTRGGAQKP